MTDTDSRPMHSQGLLLIAVAVGVLMMAVYLTANIIENENGGISAAVRTIGIGLAICALVRPKAGLYIISIEAFTLDYVKKFAVYYGAVSMGTVIEVLVIGMLAAAGAITGFLLQSVALRRYKLPPLLWTIFFVALLLAMGMFLEGKKTVGLEKAAENAFNCCIYIAIALPMAMTLTTREETSKLLNLQFFLCTTWAMWGIKQYYFGFTPMEWFYAETGLSAVASDHMIRIGDVRPFGFGSGVPNYAVLGPYFCYGAWQILNGRKSILMKICTAILFWGIITSLQRTMFLLPALVICVIFCLQTMRRAMATYCSVLALFVVGVIFSEYLYTHINDINEAISVQGFWGENMLTVGTYSDRLGSWMNLKNPANYSVFGLQEQVASHDAFSAVLISYGVVGLLGTVFGITAICWIVLRTLHRVEDPGDKQFAIFCMTITVLAVGLGFFNGSNLTSNPLNLAVWTFFGVSISTVINSKLAPVPVKASVRELLKILEASKAKAANAARIPMAARTGITVK